MSFTIVLLDFGDMDYSCPNCGALVWYEDQSDKCHQPSNPLFSICCMKGNIKLPYLLRSPGLLWNLIHGLDSRSSNFLDNIRTYNSMFEFTSMGGKIDASLNDGGGPPQFVITGQNYHRIGSLLPSGDERPKFAQLYIYDTNNEIANRMFHFR